MNIYASESLKELLTLHCPAGFQLVDDPASAALLAVEDGKELQGLNDNALFIIIWERHREDIISAVCKRYHTRLRGFIRKNDTKTLCATLEDVATECSRRDRLQQEAKTVIDSGEFIKVGSTLEIASKSSGDNQQRFTSLFVDQPMLKLVTRLSPLLKPMKEKGDELKMRFGGLLEKIQKNKAVTDNGFDRELEEESDIRFEPILLTGETGVGKTLIASWIHENSGLPGTLQEINASGLSTTMLESELFGHVKGTFTDAKDNKAGKALLAYGGVLFLDEIGDMPLELQPRVMKFIEEQRFTPDGWDRVGVLHAPVQVIAATNKDLKAEVARGTFRQDLLARFRHRIEIPSIEERKGSLDVLLDLLLQQDDIGKGVEYVANSAIKLFSEIRYEENFRGLERIVKQAADEARALGITVILPEMVRE